MIGSRLRRNAGVAAGALLLGIGIVGWSCSQTSSAVSQGIQPTSGGYVVNDTHFHLTNYVQEGLHIQDFLKTMGDKVGRVALFGIPLQQQWAYGNTGDFAP